MGKKSKRSRGSGGGSNSVAAAGASATEMDTGVKHPTENEANEIKSSEISDNNDSSPNKLREAPALRSEQEDNDNHDTNEEEETADNLRYEDPYEDLYEDEMEDDDEYEDVYESSGEEDEEEGEYMEAMAMDGEQNQQHQTHQKQSKQTKQSKQSKLPPLEKETDESNIQIQSWNPFHSSQLSPSDRSSLIMDETAYKMHHALTPEWPSLTLDVLPDAHLGNHRTRFPHTVTLVVGSQADNKNKNKLTVLRMSDLSRIPGSGDQKKLDDEMLGEEWKHDDEEDDDDEEESSDEEEEELDPILEHYSFPHPSGGINRIRACPQNSSIVACWSDAGIVSLYDVGGALDLLDRSATGGKSAKSINSTNQDGDNNNNNREPSTGMRKLQKDPFFVYSGHSTEGYALDWSRVTPGRLATADCDGHIHIWDATHPVIPSDIAAQYSQYKKRSPWSNSSFDIQPTYSPHGPNIDHPSVEDLQWSPTEATVLASGECGGYVRIYDTRCPNRSMISNRVCGRGEEVVDVNVIAWNRLVSNLLASGGDDGSFSVWDLRNFQTPDPSTPPQPLARFHSHRTPITSLEWHPTDESMIAVSDDMGTYIYDLSIEEDEPNHGTNGTNGTSSEYGEHGVEGEIPPQLLFVHNGSEMTKEVHWHPQIPSCVATTSLSGFSVFIPSNL